MDLISVIVPVYNVEKYLKRCIDSLVHQTYKNLEIIIVNDGSTDNSANICKILSEKYDNIIVINQENRGLSAARNKGLQNCSGKYIGFVDSDDWVSEDMFSYLYELIQKYEGTVARVMMKITSIQNDFKIFDGQDDVHILEGDEILQYYLTEEDYSVCNKLYARNILGDSPFKEGMINEDILANFEILKNANRLISSNKIMYYYYQGNDSITNGRLKKRDFDLLKVSQYLVDLSLDLDKNILNLAKIKLYRSYFSLLAKIARFGYSNDFEDKKVITNYLLKNLRSNYVTLVTAKNISFNRKLCITAFCCNFKVCRLGGFLYRKLKG